MRRRDTATPRLKPLSAQQMLDAGLDVRANIAMRQQRTPSQVLGMWMENIGAGVGIGAIPAVVLVFVGASVETWAGAWLVVGACAGGWLMWRRGSIDESAMRKSEHMIDKAFRQQEADCESQIQQAQVELEIERVDWRNQRKVFLDEIDSAAAEIEQLKAANDELARERDRALTALNFERQNASRRNGTGEPVFVPADDPTPQHVKDATRMLSHWYMAGEHPSKERSKELWKWDQTRWQAAQRVLVRAGVLTINSTQPKWADVPMGEAYRKLGEHLIHSEERMSAAQVNRALGVTLYVESEESEFV